MIAWLTTLFISTAWGASFSGSLKASPDFYPEDLGPPTETLVPYLQLEMASKHKFTKSLRTQWKLSALSNPSAEAKGATEELPFNEQLFVDLPEAYVEGKFGSTKLRAGMNTINWGVVDGYSPSNVVNTAAYLHPLRTPKRGSPMVEMQTGGESLALHALYIPYQPRAILPATNSRWLPRSFLMNSSLTTSPIRLPEPMEYSYGPEIELNDARKNNYGAKLSSHFGSWDFQVTHFEGASPMPKIRPSMTFNFDPATQEWTGSSPARLDPVSYRTRTSGFGLVYAGEKWIYRLETAYTHVISEGYGLDPYSWMSVAGFETNLSVGTSTITVLGQYYHNEVPTRADNQISSSSRLFDRTAVLGMRWPYKETLTFNLAGIFDTKNEGMIVTAGFEQKLKDALKWGLSWREFSSRGTGLIKTYDKNDHASMDLTYFF